MDNKTIFQARLAEVRKSRGLSRRELCAQIGSGSPLVSGYEEGYSVPSFVYLRKLAVALDVNVDYLIGVSDHRSACKGTDLYPHMIAPCFSSRLEYLKTKNGLDQQALANRTGYQRQHIDALEKGVWLPAFKGLLRIVEGLGVSADFLMGLNDKTQICRPQAKQSRPGPRMDVRKTISLTADDVLRLVQGYEIPDSIDFYSTAGEKVSGDCVVLKISWTERN